MITCLSEAYPQQVIQADNTGLFFVPAANAEALAKKVAELACQPELVFQARQQALFSYQHHFSNEKLRQDLEKLIANFL